MPFLNGVEYILNENSVSVSSASEAYQLTDIALESNRSVVIDWTFHAVNDGSFNTLAFIDEVLAVYEIGDLS